MSDPVARVLVVDDDDAFCELVGMWLKPAYEVARARDGEEALEIMRRQRPDVALVDVMMPRLSGVELARRIRSDPDLRGVPLLFMSAYHAILESHEREVIKPWGLLSKPFPRDVLTSRLREILDARRDGQDC